MTTFTHRLTGCIGAYIQMVCLWTGLAFFPPPQSKRSRNYQRSMHYICWSLVELVDPYVHAYSASLEECFKN